MFAFAVGSARRKPAGIHTAGFLQTGGSDRGALAEAAEPGMQRGAGCEPPSFIIQASGSQLGMVWPVVTQVG